MLLSVDYIPDITLIAFKLHHVTIQDDVTIITVFSSDQLAQTRPADSDTRTSRESVSTVLESGGEDVRSPLLRVSAMASPKLLV